MNWRAHFLIGSAAAIIFIAIMINLGFNLLDNPLLSVILVLFGGMSALVPDLDHHDSKGKAILDIGFILIIAFYIYNVNCGIGLCLPPIDAVRSMIQLFLAMVGAYFLFFRFFKPAHRGITHTLFASAIYGIIIYCMLDWMPALVATSGYFSHLVADFHIKWI